MRNFTLDDQRPSRGLEEDSNAVTVICVIFTLFVNNFQTLHSQVTSLKIFLKKPLIIQQICRISILARCLKITEKVSFNIASEASYVYILRGQK